MTSVVVGAGILGATMAYQLATRGEDVVLFEADAIASGASGGIGTRGLRANYRAIPEMTLAARAGQLWRSLRSELRLAARFDGNLLVTERPAVGSSGGLDSLEDRAWVQSSHGITTHVVGRDEVHDLEPHLHQRIAGGLYVPDDGDIDHDTATRTLAEEARRAGATIHEGDPVVGIRVVARGRAEVTSRSQRRLVADGGVFLFANGGLRDLLSSCLQVRLPIWQLYPQLVRVRPAQPGLLSHGLGHDHRPLTLRPLPNGDLLYAGRWRGRHDARTGRGAVDQEAVQGHLAAGAETIPAVADADVLEADASRADTGSPDGLPIIDALPGGVYFASGWGGHGYGIAPAVVEALLDWRGTGSRPESLARLGLSRFGADLDDGSGELSERDVHDDHAGERPFGRSQVQQAKG